MIPIPSVGFIFKFAVVAPILSCFICAQASDFDEAILLGESHKQIQQLQTQVSAQKITQVQSFLNSAKSMVGLQYVFGGESRENGVDCSGLVRIALRESVGLDMPRTAKEMSNIGKRIKQIPLMDALKSTKSSIIESKLAPGDLVFFNTMKRSFSHVGIYLGNNEFVHAPKSGEYVRVERIDKSYWASKFNGARRILSQTANAKNSNFTTTELDLMHNSSVSNLKKPKYSTTNRQDVPESKDRGHTDLTFEASEKAEILELFK